MKKGSYRIIADGFEVADADTLSEAKQLANAYAFHTPEALSVTVDQPGLTLYNATPGESECQAGCGAQTTNRICEACT